MIKPLEPERFHELPVEANPASAVVIVNEDDVTHEIKSYWIGQLQVHIEPVYMCPEDRDGFTGLRMYAAMLAALNTFGIKTYFAFADKVEIANYLERLGLQLTPFVTYFGIVPEVPKCPLSSQPSLPQVEPSVVASLADPAQTI